MRRAIVFTAAAVSVGFVVILTAAFLSLQKQEREQQEQLQRALNRVKRAEEENAVFRRNYAALAARADEINRLLDAKEQEWATSPAFKTAAEITAEAFLLSQRAKEVLAENEALRRENEQLRAWLSSARREAAKWHMEATDRRQPQRAPPPLPAPDPDPGGWQEFFRAVEEGRTNLGPIELVPVFREPEPGPQKR